MGLRKTGPYWVTGEYFYRSRHCAAGLVLVGDAFAFLDPVFSPGVFIARRGGEMAAGDVSASRFHHYGVELCRRFEAMRRLVYTSCAKVPEPLSHGKPPIESR